MRIVSQNLDDLILGLTRSEWEMLVVILEAGRITPEDVTRMSGPEDVEHFIDLFLPAPKSGEEYTIPLDEFELILIQCIIEGVASVADDPKYPAEIKPMAASGQMMALRDRIVEIYWEAFPALDA